MKHKRYSAGKVALTGLLAALALCLWAVEGLLPLNGLLPPGVKPGLANIVTMFACYGVGLPAAVGIVLCKAGMSLLTRGAVAGLLSLCGGLLSALTVWGLFRLDKRGRMGFLGISMAGAVGHNVGQLMAVLTVTSLGVLWYLPVLLVSATVSGSLTGLLFRLLYPYLTRLPVTHEKKHDIQTERGKDHA